VNAKNATHVAGVHVLLNSMQSVSGAGQLVSGTGQLVMGPGGQSLVLVSHPFRWTVGLCDRMLGFWGQMVSLCSQTVGLRGQSVGL